MPGTLKPGRVRNRPPRLTIQQGTQYKPQTSSEKSTPTHASVQEQSESLNSSSQAESRPTVSVNDVKYEVMLLYLRQQQLERRWASDNTTEGVVLKRGKGDFICQPAELPKHTNGFYDEIQKLNVKVRNQGIETTSTDFA